MAEKQSEAVLVARPEPWFAIITLNREVVRNAISREMATLFVHRIGELEKDGALRALVLTGAGDKAFSAGADLKERGEMRPEERSAHTDQIRQMADRIASFPVPVIAAVNGFALAGGAELAIACDLRAGGESTVFGFPEVKWGIFPGAGGMERLPRIVGSSNARHLLFTGRQIDAREAFRIGLLDVLVSDREIDAAAMRLAREIAAQSPVAIRALKQAIRLVELEESSRAAELVRQLRSDLDVGPDYEEGLTAFAEKRDPRWVRDLAD